MERKHNQTVMSGLAKLVVLTLMETSTHVEHTLSHRTTPREGTDRGHAGTMNTSLSNVLSVQHGECTLQS